MTARRHGIGRRAALALLMLPQAARQAAAQEAPGVLVPPGPLMSAKAFLDTVGVGAHWDYKDTVYGKRTQQLIDLLAGSGIRHVRGYDRAISEQLADRGVLAMHVAGPEVGTPDQVASLVQRANRSGQVIDAVEGPNEGDLFWRMKGYSYRGERFPEGVMAYQRALYRAMKSRPGIADVRVIGPSLGRTYDPGTGLHNPFPAGSMADAVDWGNFHPYPFGGNSFSPQFSYGTIKNYYWSGNFPSANLDEFPYNTLVYAPPFRPKPMAATETGYFTGRDGVSEAVHARYIPRLFAEYARLGIRRTYLYELADEVAPGTNGTKEAHFGLLRADATPKPAFTALRSLLRLIGRDVRADVDLVRPELTITPRMPVGYDRTGFVHSLLLQSTKGRYLLLLWHEVASADASSTPPREIAVPAGSVVVGLPPPLQATCWHTYDSAWELRRHVVEAASDRVEVPLRDEVVVVAIAAPS